MQAIVDFGEQSLAYLLVVFVECQLIEPLLEVDNGHLYQVGDRHALNFHPTGFLLQSCAVTGRAHGPAPVSAHHDTVLYFVLVFLHHLEERINAHLVVNVLLLF